MRISMQDYSGKYSQIYDLVMHLRLGLLILTIIVLRKMLDCRLATGLMG